MFLLDVLYIKLVGMLEHLVLAIEGKVLGTVVLSHFLIVPLKLKCLTELGLQRTHITSIICPRRIVGRDIVDWRLWHLSGHVVRMIVLRHIFRDIWLV